MPKPTFLNLAQEKRERIELAAVEVFAQKPYGQATLDQVAQLAGVSKGSLYQYFSGKADLYRYLLLDRIGARKMAAIAQDAPGPEASLWEFFEHVFLVGVAFSLKEPNYARLGVRFLRDYDQDPELTSIAVSHREHTHQWIQALLVRAQQRGELREDLDIGITTPLIARSLGEGLIDLLAGLLGISYEEYMDNPQRSAELSSEQLRAGFGQLIGIFQRGMSR